MSLKSINVVALSTNNESAISLAKSCFPGLQCNNDDFKDHASFTVDGINVDVYTKYPNYESTKTFPEYLDFLLVSVPAGHENESEILDYANSRLDCREVYLIDDGEARKLPGEIYQTKANTVENCINVFKEDLKSFLNECGDSDDTEFVRNKRKMVSAKERYVENRVIGIIENKAFPIFLHMKNNFQGFDINKGYSKNTLSFDFSPSKSDSDDSSESGIGLALNIFFGEAFDKNNLHLPLNVKDNLLTGSIELKAKSAEQADEVLSILKNAYQVFVDNGLTFMLKTYCMIDVSFSKDGSSVFVDFVFGGNFGESIIHKFRDMNLFDFNHSFNDTIRILTKLNFSDLWENPDLDSIINKLINLTIDGQGNFINFRTVFYFLREFHKVNGTSQGDKKLGIYGSSILLMLSCFEKSNFELKYDPKELKGSIMELADEILQGEGSANAFIGMFNEQYSSLYLPMFLGLVKSYSSLIKSFGNLSVIDFDSISLEALVPAVKLELKLDLLLPGLTNFIEKNVLNN